MHSPWLKSPRPADAGSAAQTPSPFDSTKVPRKCVPKIMSALAFKYWPSAIQTIGLMPLRFRDVQVEKEWIAKVNDRLLARYHVVGILATVSTTLSLIIFIAFLKSKSHPSIKDHCEEFSIPLLSFLVAVSIFILLLPRIPKVVRNSLEQAAALMYILFAGVTLVWLASTAQMSTWEQKDREVFSNVVQYNLTVRTTTHMLLTMFIVLHCLYLPLRIKLLIPSVLLVQLFTIVCNVYVTVISQRGSYVIAAWLATSLHIILSFLALTAAYCSELQVRAVTVVVRETTATVVRASSYERYASSSDLPLSPLEILVRDLTRVQNTIDGVKMDSEGLKRSYLKIISLEIAEVLQKLTMGGNLQAQVQNRVRTSNEETAEKFEALYNAVGSTEQPTMSRKRESVMFDRMASETPGAQEEHPETPQLCMEEELTARIGTDLQLTYHDISQYLDGTFCEVGYALMKPLLEVLNCSDGCLRRWLKLIDFTICKGQPYHNPTHAAMSSHFCIASLRAIGLYELLTDLEVVGVTIAALGRWVTQTGREDSYYVRTNSIVAQVYSDQDVLQSVTLQALMRTFSLSPECNILRELSEENWRFVRRFIADLILNMSQGRHFSVLSQIRVLRHSPNLGQKGNEINRKSMCTAVLKLSVAPQLFVPWEEQLEWALRWVEERYQQGDDEKTLGLRVSALTDRNFHDSFPKTVINYVTVVLLPIWREVCRYDPTETYAELTSPCLEENMNRWAQLRREGRSVAIPTEVEQLRMGAAILPVFLSAKLWRAHSYQAAFVENLKLNLVER